uniref:type IV pilus twitching motility protein PilT n=1 Tax=Desulfurobacterium sp. TaxID=2004706 RepID=UPI002615B1C7
LPDIVKNFVKYDKGLVLVTGPTGSGKTTTLASLINLILTTYRKHVITIEDPIEFVFKHGKGIVNQRQLEVDTRSFYRALKSALREKPDVILVGELRDPETMEVALTAAETGHLVFSTLHTNSAIETINRIVSVFPSTKQDQIRTQLSFVLKGVISQKLLKRRDRQGRVLAAEVMVPNNAIKSLIRDNKIEQIRNYINPGNDTGILMEESLARLARMGMVEYEEALMVANDKKYFENLYRRIRV